MSDEMVRAVARSLDLHLRVRRLEEGFDLSGVNSSSGSSHRSVISCRRWNDSSGTPRFSHTCTCALPCLYCNLRDGTKTAPLAASPLRPDPRVSEQLRRHLRLRSTTAPRSLDRGCCKKSGRRIPGDRRRAEAAAAAAAELQLINNASAIIGQLTEASMSKAATAKSKKATSGSTPEANEVGPPGDGEDSPNRGGTSG